MDEKVEAPRARINEIDWLAKKFGRLSGSIAAGVTRRTKFSYPERAALEVFQLWRHTKQSQDLMNKGRAAEPGILRDAAIAFNYVYIIEGEPDFKEDEELPWMGVTVDQLTEDRCVEAKYKAGRLENVRLRPQRLVPIWRLDQCMMQMRVWKRKRLDLIEASKINLTRTKLAPAPGNAAAYWAKTMPMYWDFYRKYLAWYWEKDLSKADDFKAACAQHGITQERMDAVLKRAFTDPHIVLVDGRRPLTPEQKAKAEAKRSEVLGPDFQARVEAKKAEIQQRLAEFEERKRQVREQLAAHEPTDEEFEILNPDQLARIASNRARAIQKLRELQEEQERDKDHTGKQRRGRAARDHRLKTQIAPYYR